MGFGGDAQLFVYACDICVALGFYELLKPVSKRTALLAAFFRLVFAATASINILNHFAPSAFIASCSIDIRFTSGYATDGGQARSQASHWINLLYWAPRL